MSEALSEDLLHGADEIARFLFGTPRARRRIYYLAENSQVPVFKVGHSLWARRSTLVDWISTREAEAL